MSLLDAPPYNASAEKRKTRLRIAAAISLAVVLLLFGAYQLFWSNLVARHVVDRFLGALEAGNYQEAYYIWHPVAKVYTMDAFMEDWGPKSHWGAIKSYRIVQTGRPQGLTSAAGVSGVVVVIQINGMPDAARLWVEKKSPHVMSFYQF